MKIHELRELPDQELATRLKEEQENLANLFFQKATSQLESPIKIRTSRPQSPSTSALRYHGAGSSSSGSGCGSGGMYSVGGPDCAYSVAAPGAYWLGGPGGGGATVGGCWPGGWYGLQAAFWVGCLLKSSGGP